MTPYDQNFYDTQSEGSIRSANKYLAYLFEDYTPSSIVDFGCGVGSWLYAAKNLGVKELIGFDGPWVSKEQLLTKFDFHAMDFRNLENIDCRCDLAISVEVAEHFDEAYADKFVQLLCRCSDLVIFGAAIPGQGGRHHVNEQPQSYWVKKFSESGFICFDYFRPTFWNDEDIEVWYRQNTLLFVRSTRLAHYPFVSNLDQKFIYNIVHPELFRHKERRTLARADILREAAIQLESENLALAFLLMAESAKARPKGKFIREKLQSYITQLAEK